MGKTSVNYSVSLSYTATGNWDKAKRCQKFPGSDGCRMGLLPVPTTGRAKKWKGADKHLDSLDPKTIGLFCYWYLSLLWGGQEKNSYSQCYRYFSTTFFKQA